MSGSLLVNVDVPDLARAVDFYTRAFEWTVGRRFGGEVVELLGAGVPVFLLLRDPGTAPAPGAAPRDYDRHWTPVHLDVVVDDIEVALDRAEALGAVRESHPDTHPWGRIVRLADPFGHGLCLIQFLGRGYDEIAGAT